jgi:hypothetical protein
MHVCMHVSLPLHRAQCMWLRCHSMGCRSLLPCVWFLCSPVCLGWCDCGAWCWILFSSQPAVDRDGEGRNDRRAMLCGMQVRCAHAQLTVRRNGSCGRRRWLWPAMRRWLWPAMSTKHATVNLNCTTHDRHDCLPLAHAAQGADRVGLGGPTAHDLALGQQPRSSGHLAPVSLGRHAGLQADR